MAKSKILSLQFHPDISPGCDTKLLIGILEGVCKSINEVMDLSVDQGKDNGGYVNINIKTTDIAYVWKLLQRHKDIESILSQSMIVVCEGENGWNDYLLLHHYDKKEKIDEIKRHTP